MRENFFEKSKIKELIEEIIEYTTKDEYLQGKYKNLIFMKNFRCKTCGNKSLLKL